MRLPGEPPLVLIIAMVLTANLILMCVLCVQGFHLQNVLPDHTAWLCGSKGLRNVHTWHACHGMQCVMSSCVYQLHGTLGDGSVNGDDLYDMQTCVVAASVRTACFRCASVSWETQK